MNTPTYAFKKSELIRCYETIKVLMGDIRIFYTLKANANRDVLQVLASIGADFDVASLGEYNVLKDIGVQSERIICGLPMKPIKWIEQMYETGCNYYTFDTIAELNKIKKYAPNSKKILRVGITDILPKSIDFGMPYEEIMQWLSTDFQFRDDTDGVLFHISNNVSIDAFNSVLDRIETVLRAFNKHNMIINMGGGYRINADPNFFVNLNKKVQYFKQNYGVTVIAEPGNTIVNTSGRIFTTVIGVKKRDNYHYDLYMDAGKPSGIKTDEKRIPGYIKHITNCNACEEKEYRFIDITCMHLPHFSIKLKTPVFEGDIFEFGDMGAYSICLRSDFHAWPSPDVIID